MTYLVGAWLRQSADLAVRFPPARRRAIRSLLPDDGFREYCSQRLWLLGSADQVKSEDGQVVAVEGFSADVGARELLSDWCRRGQVDLTAHRNAPFSPPGHASVVRADGTCNVLELTRGLIGGERLYYLERGPLVLFAGSIRYLLGEHGGVPAVDGERLPEALLTGMALFGDGTLARDIREVRPGHTVRWSDGRRSSVWHGPDLMALPRDDIATEAGRFHDTLIEAMVAAAGHARPVAVTLSGGIDSSAIAALAVEAFGADRVTAYTYEFDDPGHPCETPYAAAVCRRLGIADHRIFGLSMSEYLSAIPQTVWRTESLSSWPKAFMLEVTRRIRDDGFDRYFTGFGIGSHMQYFADLARCRSVLGVMSALHWGRGQRARGRWLRHLEQVHPGLALPGWRLLLPVLWVLRERGELSDLAGYYPPEARDLARLIPAADPDLGAAVRAPRLVAALRQFAFERLISCVDVTRWEKFSRELGVWRISPAHFAAPLPYAYLPPAPPGRLRPADRALRPGKLLLRTAMAEVLPPSVLYRRKSWADAVISPRWFEAGANWMATGATNPDPIQHLLPDLAASTWRWDRRAPQAAASAFSLWWRLFIARSPTGEVPTWSEVRNTIP